MERADWAWVRGARGNSSCVLAKVLVQYETACFEHDDVGGGSKTENALEYIDVVGLIRMWWGCTGLGWEWYPVWDMIWDIHRAI